MCPPSLARPSATAYLALETWVGVCFEQRRNAMSVAIVGRPVQRRTLVLPRRSGRTHAGEPMRAGGEVQHRSLYCWHARDRATAGAITTLFLTYVAHLIFLGVHDGAHCDEVVEALELAVESRPHEGGHALQRQGATRGQWRR